LHFGKTKTQQAVDSARRALAAAINRLREAEKSGDPQRIITAKEAVTAAEKDFQDAKDFNGD
jgi:hypothetical protein